MDPAMQTISAVSDAVLSVASGITIIAVAVSWLLRGIAACRKPEETQNEKIQELKLEVESIKKRMDDHDAYLSNDKRHIESIESGNRVTQEALLALLSHAISGDGIEELRKAENSLKYYLIHNKEIGGKTNE